MPSADIPLQAHIDTPRSAVTDWADRLARCIGGLALFGVGIALILEAKLGAAPWDVFHQGISRLTNISVGTVIVATGLILLLVWIPLRQRPGIGTLLNALEIGITVNVIEPLVPEVEAGWLRVIYLVTGILAIAVGSGAYIGAGLGTGPRDGIMMGLKARGLSVRVARTIIEITVLIIGALLGGTIGIGTLAFTVAIGPLVHALLPPLTLRPRKRPSRKPRLPEVRKRTLDPGSEAVPGPATADQ